MLSRGAYFLNAGVEKVADGTVTYLDRRIDVLPFKVLDAVSDSVPEEARDKLQHQQKKMEALTDELRRAQDRLKRLQELLELMKLEIEDSLELVRRSWSWRITYLLRLVPVTMARVRAFALATVTAHFRFQQRRRQKARIQVLGFLKESRLFDESFPLGQKQNVATQQAWPDIRHVDQSAVADRAPVAPDRPVNLAQSLPPVPEEAWYFLKQLAGEHRLARPAKIALYIQ